MSCDRLLLIPLIEKKKTVVVYVAVRCF